MAQGAGGEICRRILNLTDASHQLCRRGRAGAARKGIHLRRHSWRVRLRHARRRRDRFEEKPDRRFHFENHSVLVSRTGYTGEDGFEIVGPEDGHPASCGTNFSPPAQPFGIKPCGLGARDTLRTEVCYPLYGHELDEQTTPIEAGVGFFVALDKGEFNGRAVLAEQKANGVKKKLVAFKMTDKSAPPRPHYPIWVNGANVGIVTSGTQSPSLSIGIGMGYVPPEFAKPDTKIEIDIRGTRFAAVVVPKPLFKAAKP